jgi:predicted amidohydrolase YtcJ
MILRIAAGLAGPTLLLAALAFTGGCGDSETLEADMILVGGKVITLDDRNTIAEAVAIRGDRIERVGTNREIRRLAGKDTRVVDLGGNTVVPGFNDTHLHFESGGLSLIQVRLNGVTSYNEIQERVKARADSLPAGMWIQGRGWDHTIRPGGQWPTKEILDEAVSDHPVYLRRICGHVAWVNSAALAAAGIDRSTRAPEGGEIVRDSSGNPTGILKEEAVNLVADVIPPRSAEERSIAVRTALREAARLGVTSVQEMGTHPETMKIYQDLHDRSELTVRIYASPAIDSALVYLNPLGLRSTFGDSWLRLGVVKGYADGALGAATAALLAPYSDRPETRGILVQSEAETADEILRAHRAGQQVAFHAIGDRGNRVVLDAIEAAVRSDPRPDPRHRIEHAQVLAPEDIPRFARLGVIASMQPTHCTSDSRWAEDRLGPDRAKGAYAWRSVLDSGAHLAFGTDWPIESLDPLRGLYAAVTRMDEEGRPAGGWHPEQCLTIEEALRAYTRGSAYASFEEDVKGSIEVGKLADLAVLSRPILEIPAAEILETEVVMTIVGGKIVYRKNE